MIVAHVTFTLSNVVVDPVVIFITVDAFRRIALSTTDGALDTRVLVLGVVMNTSALLSYLVMFPEISSIASLANLERLALETAVDGANLTDIFAVREVVFNTVTLVVLELSVDTGLAGLTMLSIAALNAVLDSVATSFACSILI